jgi:energy-coupling factor transporter ATP-binding protein EcfA2
VSTVQRTPPAEPVSGHSPEAEPELIRDERHALRELLQLVAERAEAEARIESTRASADGAADAEYERGKAVVGERFEALKSNSRRADEDARRTIADAATAGDAAAKSEFSRASRRIAAEFDNVREQAKYEHARGKSQAIGAYEAGERAASAKFAEERRPIDEARKAVQSRRARLAAVFADYKKFGLEEAPLTPTRDAYRFDDPVASLYDRVGKADPSLRLLEELLIPRALKARRWLWLFVVVFGLLVYPAAMLTDWVTGAAIAAVAAVVLGFVLRTWLYSVAKAQVAKLYYPLSQTMVDAEALAVHCLSAAEERLKAERDRLTRRRDEDQLAAKQAQARTVSKGEESRDEQLREINRVYAQKAADIQMTRRSATAAAAEDYERRTAEIRAQNEATTRRLDEKYRDLKEKIRSRHETSWQEMEARWREGMGHVEATRARVSRDVDALGPPWDDPAWNDRPMPASIPPIVRLGEVRVDLNQLPQGLPRDARLREGIPPSFLFPALLPFPDRANLLVEAPQEGREAAVGVLRAAMLRLLMGLPPGQVRFTIVDPVGIGRNFGAFMHLADADEALVTNQVWTEPRQIAERLADLAAHMEKVTQKYLRNEYATLGEYNAVAGEVAESYRVLVIADFPNGFNDQSSARLLDIAAKGVPCGVLTLVAVDPSRPMPDGFSLDELRRHATILTRDGDRFTWDDPDLGRFPLTLDSLPNAETTNRLIHRAGAAAKAAKRVEVSFEFIAPEAGAWWTKDSRSGIDIPLGKAGATKRQHLTLGHGTSQHVLIAGRTGSGKSTLLHALITNLALNYGPDEVDLYLIDFKKGVEFKVYARYDLPHASVVAIESEREFGISVLQKLDDEMRDRGERFRDAGVQDLAGFRNAPGTPPLPRALLIVDEFQEFFVEDDRVAQEASRLLDRLVRQGRAFGIHVLLGSQTLGGAYALARSTLGQMAVRVALQCSDADAPMILSEANTAAKLLTRPGEAVYNDANGQAEGNHFFQVVWLGDDRREAYLKQLRDFARDRPPALARKQIVFEGDAAADLARNPALATLLDAPSWPASPRSAQGWVGDPIAIKEPTSALFRRQGGNHLLVVGQNGDAATGVMASALIGLAAQYPPAASETVRDGARFVLLDGTPEDEPRAGYLAGLAGILPHPVVTGDWNDTARFLAELAADVERRQQPGSDGPETFLFLHDLARFRDLRRRPDDFGFSRRDEDAGPTDHLQTILREGPGLGVHVVLWCDNVSNLNRSFDQNLIRELEMRVLFQMSQTDSGLLLDAPHAAKLGQNRALFYSEDQNRLEKFRPYGRPSAEWLDRVRERFAARGAASGTTA